MSTTLVQHLYLSQRPSRSRHRRLSRRTLHLGLAAALSTCLSGCPSSKKEVEKSQQSLPSQDGEDKDPLPPPSGTSNSTKKEPVETQSRIVSIKTPDGDADAFFVFKKGAQRRPIVLWPDSAGARDAFKTMANQLAEVGLAVLVVNPYYRSAKLPLFDSFAASQTKEARTQLDSMRRLLTPKAVERDARAFVAWLSEQPEVDPHAKVGTVGYGAGAPFALRTAAVAPDRVRSVVAIHGKDLVTDDPKSPHLLFQSLRGSYVILIARDDNARHPEHRRVLEAATDIPSLSGTVAVYPAENGFCILDSSTYDEEVARKAFGRMVASFGSLAPIGSPQR